MPTLIAMPLLLQHHPVCNSRKMIPNKGNHYPPLTITSDMPLYKSGRNQYMYRQIGRKSFQSETKYKNQLNETTLFYSQNIFSPIEH